MAASATAQSTEETESFPTLPLSIAVAEVDGEPVVDDAWLDERIEWANRIFASPGLSFTAHERRSLPEEHAALETRRDRHRLGAHRRPSVINVFVVASLRDVDDPSRYRQGVHWRAWGRNDEHYVIVSAVAGPTVLAHELGHFFGNRVHPETPGNIMSYDRGDGVPFFDDDQVDRIQRFTRRFLRSRELVAADRL